MAVSSTPPMCSAIASAAPVMASLVAAFGRFALRSHSVVVRAAGAACPLLLSVVATGHEELEEATGEPWVKSADPAKKNPVSPLPHPHQ